MCGEKEHAPTFAGGALFSGVLPQVSCPPLKSISHSEKVIPYIIRCVKLYTIK